MSRTARTPLRGYGAAIAAVALALLLNFLWPGTYPTVFPLFFASVVLAAWYGGLGPGLLATALSTLAIHYYFIEPAYSFVFGTAIVLRLAVFVMVAVVISHLTASLSRAETARRDIKDLYRRMVENARDYAIFMLDPQGKVISWNVGAERLLGYGRGEIIGRPFSVFFTPEDNREGGPDSEMELAMTTGRAEDERWHVRKHGTRFWAFGVLNSVRDEGGELRGFVKVMRDLTERKRAEDERAGLLAREQEARREAEEARARAEAIQAEVEAAGQAKDRFLAMLSHELRTPLNPVLLTVSAMLDDPRTPADFRPTLEMFRQNIGLEARLIDDLLDVMRTIRGKMSFHWDVVDAHVMIGKALDICRSDIRDKRIRLVLDLTASEHHARADAGRLQQVWWNLIKNAVKFTPEGGTVAIRTRDEGGRLVVEVADTGIGIEPAALHKIFNAFEQVENSITRSYGGLGLGLAISKAIIEAHEGTLTVSSAGVGRGATFIVVLATVPAEEQAPRPITASPSEHRALSLLLVEDDAVTSRITARLLRNAGYVVTTASSYDTALEVASPEFDLVVCDIGLPGRSGLDLMRELQGRHGLVGIALSGYGMEGDIERSREAGFVAHLTKPVDFATLDRMIQEATVSRRLMRGVVDIMPKKSSGD